MGSLGWVLGAVEPSSAARRGGEGGGGSLGRLWARHCRLRPCACVGVASVGFARAFLPFVCLRVGRVLPVVLWHEGHASGGRRVAAAVAVAVRRPAGGQPANAAKAKAWPASSDDSSSGSGSISLIFLWKGPPTYPPLFPSLLHLPAYLHAWPRLAAGSLQARAPTCLSCFVLLFLS